MRIKLEFNREYVAFDDFPPMNFGSKPLGIFLFSDNGGRVKFITIYPRTLSTVLHAYIILSYRPMTNVGGDE